MIRSLDVVARRAERPVLVARAAAGVALLAAPGVVSQLWLGHRSVRSCWFVRAIGIRDLALCLGQVRARSADAHRRWQRAGGLADVSDAAIAIGAAVAGRRPISAAIAVPALGAAVLTLGADPVAGAARGAAR